MRIRSPLNSKAQVRLELQARQHASCLTESEARLWSALKARQFGVQFRVEVPLAGRFIVDFFASSIGWSLKWMAAITHAAGALMRAAIGSCAGLVTASSAWMRS